jgi:hypothetical protein
MLDRFEECSLALRSRESIRRLRTALLPCELRVVVADAVLAFGMVLLVTVDMHHFGDDLSLAVQHGTTVAPVAIG